jgi:hypothetical protein
MKRCQSTLLFQQPAITRSRCLLGVAAIVSMLLAACDGQERTQSDSPAPVAEVQQQAVTVQPQELSASSAADKAASERKLTGDNYGALKKRIADLNGDQQGALNDLHRQLEGLREKALVHPGEGGAVPGATGTAVSKIDPALYAKLNAKMKDFDMNNPAHVAAWGDLKKKELGR